MKLGGSVPCTKISPELEFGVQRSKVKVTRDKKRQSAGFFRERSSQTRSSVALCAVYVWQDIFSIVCVAGVAVGHATTLETI